MEEMKWSLVLLLNLLEETSQGLVGEEAGPVGAGGEAVMV